MLLAAAFLVAFLVFAVSVDVGCTVVARESLRRLVDHAALVGAHQLADRISQDHHREHAIASARTSAGAHLVRLARQAGARTKVEVGSWDFDVGEFTTASPYASSVQVAATSVSARLFFAPFFGLKGQTVSRRSVAVIEPRHVVYVFSERNATTNKAISLLIRDCRRDAEVFGGKQTACVVREPNGWQVFGDQTTLHDRLTRALRSAPHTTPMRDVCSIAWHSLLLTNSGDSGQVIQVKQRFRPVPDVSASGEMAVEARRELREFIVRRYDPTDSDGTLVKGLCDALHIIDDDGDLLHLNLRHLSLDHQIRIVDPE